MPDSALEILERLVAYPTVAGTPNGEMVDEIAARLERVGAQVSVTPGTRPDAVNLHAVVGPPAAEGGVLLAAHSDVVAVDGQAWSRDPFRLHVAGGRAFGRGAADMKGFIAVVLAVAADLGGAALARPLHIAVSSDEEVGCRGLPPLLDALAALPVGPSRVIVGEPTELHAVTRHKGKAAARLTFRGRAAHSSRPTEGVNAVAYAGRLVAELVALQEELADGPRSDGFAVPFPTIGIGPISGGTAVNVVPETCRLDVEVRTPPETSPEVLLAAVEDRARRLEREMRRHAPQARVEVERLSGYPGLRSAACGLAHELAALAGTSAGGAVDFGTEAGLYQQRLGVPVVVCGPGSMAQAHRADEFVTIDQLERGERLVRAVVETLRDGG